jgi:fermentation-respiration switch protein FrsA (DUF1100 family)
MKFLTREKVIGLAVALVLAMAAFVFGLRWIEASITFHPIRASAEKLQPPKGALSVRFVTADGVKLHGWFFSSGGPAVATVIYFHGNGGNISNIDWVGERLAKRGFDVLLFDYRGYGLSEGDALEEAGLFADGDAAYEYVKRERGVPANKIVLYGQSLGTTVVADVASRHEVGVVILESGLSSASSVARTALPWLPGWLHFLGRNRFDSATKLKKVKAPVLISHGEPDEVIPTREAHALYTSANEPKKLLIFPGAGHNVFGSQGDVYFDQVESFIRQSLQ